MAPSTAPSSSRSPSPTSFQDQAYLDPNAQYSPRTITDLTPTSYNKPTTQLTSRPLPLANGTRSPQVPNHPSHLPHPARALHGPRMISSSGTRSRSPSPARSLMGSRPASRTHSRNGSLEADSHGQSEADIGAAGVRLPSDINSFQLSEKAAGKRKMVDPEPPNLDGKHGHSIFFFLLLIHFIVQMTTTASLFTYWRQRHLEQHRSRQPTLRWPNIGTFPCVMYMMRLRNERKSGFSMSMSMSTMQRRNKDLDEYSSGCCKHQCKLFPAANRLPDVSFLKLHHNS